MPQLYDSRSCRGCGRKVLAIQQGIGCGDHVVHIVMTLITCGLWAPVWAYATRERWVCSRCGGSV